MCGVSWYLFLFYVVNVPSWAKLNEPIDLSWSFDETSVYWPGISSFIYTRKVAEYRPDGSWYAMNEFCAGEHGGTHLDAPYHFNSRGWKVGDIPLNRLIAQAVCIDISDYVDNNRYNASLQVDDLKKWEQKNGPLPNHCIVLVRFGWSKYYKDYSKYMGINGTTMYFPGISADAARWIVDTKKVVGVGVDTASVDVGSSTDYPAHKMLSENQIYAMENVNIPELPATGFTLLVMPMKLRDGSGAPLRIIATPSIILGETESPKISNPLPWYGHTTVVVCTLFLLAMYSINSF